MPSIDPVIAERAEPRDRTAAYRQFGSAVRRSRRRSHNVEPETGGAMAVRAYVRLRLVIATGTVAAVVGCLAAGVSAVLAIRGDEPRIDRVIASSIALIGIVIGIVARAVARRAARTVVAVLERVRVPDRPDAATPMTVRWRRSPARVIGLAATALVGCGGLVMAWRLALGPHHPGMTAIAVILGVIVAAGTVQRTVRDVSVRLRNRGVIADLDADGVAFGTDERITWAQIANVYPTTTERFALCFVTFEWRPVGAGNIVARSIAIDDIRERPEDVIMAARTYMALRGK